MKYKKGDFLTIPTDGEYRCMIADEHIAVFAAFRYGKIHPEFLRLRTQSGTTVKDVPFDESDMIEFTRDIAY